MNVPGLSSDIGQSFDLNSEPTGIEDYTFGGFNKEESSDGPTRDEVIALEDKAMEDDPFELAPIIEAVMNDKKKKKKRS